MINANDVANFFIDIAKCSNKNMTNLRLNKLLYFAQGCALARTGKPLFNGQFEAWKLGPVMPDIYRKYKLFKNNNISIVDNDYDYNNISNDDYELLIDIASTYENYSTTALVEMSHKGPWFDAYNKHEGEIINVEKITDYFNKMPTLQSFNDTIECNDFIGYRDSDGIIVLPKEFDDECQVL